MKAQRDIDDLQERVAIKIYDANMSEADAIKQACQELGMPAESKLPELDLIEDTSQRR
jgi:hypothetical protein